MEIEKMKSNVFLQTQDYIFFYTPPPLYLSLAFPFFDFSSCSFILHFFLQAAAPLTHSILHNIYTPDTFLLFCFRSIGSYFPARCWSMSSSANSKRRKDQRNISRYIVANKNSLQCVDSSILAKIKIFVHLLQQHHIVSANASSVN